ncbi:MAG: glutamyl-tRNA amidotransferase [Spirochaetia bacterium]|nr:glutamyl-tRNA amidotransferase [Spirochaetia bacterium]
MICFDDCMYCKHEHKTLKDGWDFTCDAFPDGGMPIDFDLSSVRERKYCNNGIGFEPKEGIKDSDFIV